MDERLNKWIDSMAVFLPSEDMNRLLSNEKINNILKIVVTRFVPYERKKFAEKLLLLNSMSSESPATSHNMTDTSIRLDLIKRYVKLKKHLKEKEQELTEKKKSYSELVKNIQTLVTEVQLTNCAVDEERKKMLIMLLNKEELQRVLNDWNNLQEVLSGIKAIHHLKWKKEKEKESLNVKLMVALDDCLSQIAIFCAEVNKESDSFSELKNEIVKNITSHLQEFSWQDIFEGLTQQQQKLNIAMEALCKNVSCPASKQEEVSQFSQKASSFRDFGSIIMYQLYMRRLEFGLKGDIECKVPENLPLKFPEMEEELKLIECKIVDADKLIQKRIEELRNMKDPLRNEVNEVCKIMSQIKRLHKKLEKSERKYDDSGASLNELRLCMKQLTDTAPNELKLFSEIPLVFLEKLHYLGSKSNEGHKLMFNFQKIYPYIQQFSKTSLNVLDGTSSLSSHEIVLHLFQQLSYLGALNKTENMMKSISEENISNFSFNFNSRSEVNEKFQIIPQKCTSAASTLELNLDDIATLIQTWWTHPLNGIVPKDLVVDGTTLEYWAQQFAVKE